MTTSALLVTDRPCRNTARHLDTLIVMATAGTLEKKAGLDLLDSVHTKLISSHSLIACPITGLVLSLMPLSVKSIIRAGRVTL